MSLKDSNTEEQLRWNFPWYYRLDSILSNAVLIRCNYFRYHTFFYQWLVGKSTPDSLHSFANASGNRHANKYLHTLSWGVSGTRRIWWGEGWVLGANASSSFDFRFPPFITNYRWLMINVLLHFSSASPHRYCKGPLLLYTPRIHIFSTLSPYRNLPCFLLIFFFGKINK